MADAGAPVSLHGAGPRLMFRPATFLGGEPGRRWRRSVCEQVPRATGAPVGSAGSDAEFVADD